MHRAKMRTIQTASSRSKSRLLASGRQDRCRAGYTLIEMINVISTIAVILVVGGATLSRLMRVDDAVYEQQRLTQTLQRLAEQFRDDVHQADRAELAGNQLRLLGRDGKQAVLYEGREQLLQRVAGVDGGEPFQERFHLPAAGARFSLAENDSWVLLTIPRRAVTTIGDGGKVVEVRPTTVRAKIGLSPRDRSPAPRAAIELERPLDGQADTPIRITDPAVNAVDEEKS